MIKPRVSPAFARLSQLRCEVCDAPAKLVCCHAATPAMKHFRCSAHRPTVTEFEIVLPLKGERTKYPRPEQLKLTVGGRRPVQ